MSIRTPIAAARGLGSARAGVGHWKAQRLTALANVPLVLWFAFSVAALADAGYPDVVVWLASPLNTALMLLLIASVFYHAKLGLQVVVEDYVHHEGRKIALLAALTLGSAALAAACAVAVLKVSLGA